MTTIANYLANIPEMAEAYQELAAELAKDIEKANANRALYDAAKAVVMPHVTATPQTVQEIYDACSDELPENFSKSKVQYALINYWTDEVRKVVNAKGPNQYVRI